ncbi:MAG TPA: hypothetical protein ENF87_02690, partial [Thermoproteales archaeon]|nr:hypothetical protein [Thermoproteales archaeon]
MITQVIEELKNVIEKSVKVKTYYKEPPKEFKEESLYITLDKVKVSSKTVPVVTLEKGKVVEKLDGTGTQKTFKLKAQPLRPVERIEHPPGTLLTENRDYTVDYEKGLI